MKKILVLNIGSTSTKVALFEDENQIFKESIEVPADSIKNITKARTQIPDRFESIKKILADKKVDLKTVDIISARGGAMPKIKGGAYKVTDYLREVAKYGTISQHESSITCVVARMLADPYGIPVIIYDAVATNEADEISQITGYPGIRFNMSGHPLNARMVARTYAKQLGTVYERNAFIVAHLGGSVSVSAHSHGRIIDMTGAFNGPMSAQRAGRLPTDSFLKLCYSNQFSFEELRRKLNGQSGFMAYFGTQNAKEVLDMSETREEVDLIVRAMALQLAKAIAEMRISLNEDPLAIILTGGMAYSEKFVNLVSERVSFIGQVVTIPGEMEMEALAEGGRRVLEGEEKAKIYESVPEGFDSMEDFLKFARETEAKEKKSGI
ncbi:MAG: butyrate kinase [Lachnospiraceae bacterium]|jgi:butyrate kinase